MPTTKHKRKASAHSKPKVVKSPGLIALYPKAFIVIGLFFVALSIYLIAFKAHDNAMFGLAMLSLIAGVVLVIYTKIVVTNKSNKKRSV